MSKAYLTYFFPPYRCNLSRKFRNEVFRAELVD